MRQRVSCSCVSRRLVVFGTMQPTCLSTKKPQHVIDFNTHRSPLLQFSQPCIRYESLGALVMLQGLLSCPTMKGGGAYQLRQGRSLPAPARHVTENLCYGFSKCLLCLEGAAGSFLIPCLCQACLEGAAMGSLSGRSGLSFLRGALARVFGFSRDQSDRESLLCLRLYALF